MNHSSSDEALYPDNEEVAFLRSHGWEENGEDESLTEEEISSFYREVTTHLAQSLHTVWFNQKILLGS